MNISVFMMVWSAMFFAIIMIFIYKIIMSLKTYFSNNNSPIINEKVLVTSKRMQISRNGAGNNAMHTYTSYFVTFQLEAGERIELKLNGNQYALISEKDEGDLSYQGTRFLGFDRKY